MRPLCSATALPAALVSFLRERISAHLGAQCEQYKAANARLLRRHKAARLVKAYFDGGSDSVLDGMGLAELKAETLAAYSKEDPAPHLFDPLQNAIERVIEKDVLPGFYESPQYKELFAANGDFSAVLSAEDFDILKFLGAGGFGMVLLVRRRATRRLYAMKVMDKRILISRKQVFSVFREKAALAHVTHPFIVSLKYALETEHLLLLICDFEKGGNMYSNIITHGAYPLDRTRMYAAEMVLAIAQVHEMGILYRDMKPDNILLDADGHCKLADMGAARGENAGGEIEIDGLSEENRHKTLRPSELQATIALEELEKTLEESTSAADQGIERPVPRSNRMTITGTHGYRAPEVYQRSYGKSADWWNLGLLVIEMLTGKVSVPACDGSMHALDSAGPPRAASLARCCLSRQRQQLASARLALMTSFPHPTARSPRCVRDVPPLRTRSAGTTGRRASTWRRTRRSRRPLGSPRRRTTSCAPSSCATPTSASAARARVSTRS